MKSTQTIEEVEAEVDDYFKFLEASDKAHKAEKDRIKRLTSDAAAVMSSKSGRRLMGRVLEICRLNAPVSDRNPIVMAMLSGRRDAALEIKHLLEAACPDLYDLMTKEIRNER